MNTVLIDRPLSENIFETPESYLICKNVPIARTGIQRYSEREGLTDTEGKPLPAENGWIDVFKPESVLFDSNTIASFENKPVTIGHKMIGPNNWQNTTVGTAYNVRRGEGLLKNNLLADLMITDRSAIDLIKSGTIREISLGYEATYTPDGKGKAKQTSITGNHIAIVSQGKAGHLCRIFDSVQENIEAEFMNLKEIMKNAFCTAVDKVETFDELAHLDGDKVAENAAEKISSQQGSGSQEEKCEGGSVTAENENKQVTEEKNAETVDAEIPAVQASPAATAPAPQPAQQPTAAQLLNEKLDKLLAAVATLQELMKPTADANEPEKQEKQEQPEQHKPVMVSLDPNRDPRV